MIIFQTYFFLQSSWKHRNHPAFARSVLGESHTSRAELRPGRKQPGAKLLKLVVVVPVGVFFWERLEVAPFRIQWTNNIRDRDCCFRFSWSGVPDNITCCRALTTDSSTFNFVLDHVRWYGAVPVTIYGHQGHCSETYCKGWCEWCETTIDHEAADDKQENSAWGSSSDCNGNSSVHPFCCYLTSQLSHYSDFQMPNRAPKTKSKSAKNII